MAHADQRQTDWYLRDTGALSTSGPDVELPSDAAAGPTSPLPADVASAPVGIRHALRAFRHRDFKWFWWGALASNTGSWVQNLAVPYVLYELTSSALWVGLATAAQFVPAMVLGPVGGALADRYDRRKVLLVTQSAQALAAVVLWAAWAGHLREPAVILGLVALSGVFQGLNVPSWQSFVNDLVPRRDLLSAITLNSLQFNAARAIGPAIAGVLLALLGPSWAFMINALSFLCVLVVLRFVRPFAPVAAHGPSSGSFLHQFGEAVRYAAGQPGILMGILVAVLLGVLGNPIFQFTVVFAADVYHVGPLGLGFLSVALGVGSVLAAPIVSGWDSVLDRSTVVRWGLLGYGVATVVFALSPVYLVGLVALVVVGGCFLGVISVANTAVQVIVADDMRGRVLGVRMMAFTGAYPVGALLQGWMSDVVGPRPTVAVAGAGLVLAALWMGARPGLLSSLDDPHDEGVAADRVVAPVAPRRAERRRAAVSGP